MTTLKTLSIVTALLAGGASLAMAQSGPATGGYPPVAGGAGGTGCTRTKPSGTYSSVSSYNPTPEKVVHGDKSHP
jgi:hypothetical protein